MITARPRVTFRVTVNDRARVRFSFRFLVRVMD